jgi:hypothetical protein
MIYFLWSKLNIYQHAMPIKCQNFVNDDPGLRQTQRIPNKIERIDNAAYTIELPGITAQVGNVKTAYFVLAISFFAF